MNFITILDFRSFSSGFVWPLFLTQEVSYPNIYTFCMFPGMLFHLLIVSDRLRNKIHDTNVTYIYLRTNTHTWRHVQRSLTLPSPFFKLIWLIMSQKTSAYKFHLLQCTEFFVDLQFKTSAFVRQSCFSFMMSLTDFLGGNQRKTVMLWITPTNFYTGTMGIDFFIFFIFVHRRAFIRILLSEGEQVVGCSALCQQFFHRCTLYSLVAGICSYVSKVPYCHMEVVEFKKI